MSLHCYVCRTRPIAFRITIITKRYENETFRFRLCCVMLAFY